MPSFDYSQCYKAFRVELRLDTIAVIAYNAVKEYRKANSLPAKLWSDLTYEEERNYIGFAELYMDYNVQEVLKRFGSMIPGPIDDNRYMEEIIFFSIIKSFRPYFGKAKADD